MKQDNLVLIPYTEYGIPSGNYDGSSETNFSGDRVKAANYYIRVSNTQSVRFQTDEFAGRIDIEATLDEDPVNTEDWFGVYDFPGDSTQDGSSVVTTDYVTALQGRYTWIRAVVSNFENGKILKVSLIY